MSTRGQARRRAAAAAVGALMVAVGVLAGGTAAAQETATGPVVEVEDPSPGAGSTMGVQKDDVLEGSFIVDSATERLIAGSELVEIPSPPSALRAAGDGCATSVDGGSETCLTLDGPDAAVDAAARAQVTERLSEVESAPSAGRAGEVGVQSMQDFPAWCLELGVTNSFTARRTGACGIFSGQFQIFTVSNNGVRTETGRMNFLIYRYMYTNTSLSTTWADQVQISSTLVTGTAALGVRFSGLAMCTGGSACVPVEQSFPWQAIVVAGDADGESYFSWAPVPTQVGYGIAQWELSATSVAVLGAPPGVVMLAPTPQVRCDQAMPGSASIGCVVPEVIPSFMYSKLQFPDYTRHLGDAINSALPGHPTTLRPLHRLTDQALIALNRSTSCPSTLPTKPAGKSCDEYPYASTWEGAYTGGGPGRSFYWCSMGLAYPVKLVSPTGFSACYINDTENRDQGLSLNNDGYVPSRVIEGDAFYVSSYYG